MATIPPDFELFQTSSPFIRLVGPFYAKQTSRKFTLGLLVEAQHCNSGGALHGGLISTMADIALGNNIGRTQFAASGGDLSLANDPAAPAQARPLATIHLATSFVGTARVGDWVEMHVEVHKAGATNSFASARLIRQDEVIANASGVFRHFDSQR